MIKGTIYKITCLVNGKCYIEQTFQPVETRWDTHIRGSGSKGIYNAIEKHGINMFKFEILHQGITCRDMLNKLEITLIAAHNAYTEGYNDHRGGQDEYRCSEVWEHADEICRLYTEELLSLDEIAHRYDTNRVMIQQILKAGDIKRREKSHAWEYADEICRLYTTEKKSLKQIANIYGVSDKTIHRILKINNVRTRKTGRHKEHLWQHSKEICRLYTKDLLSYQKIADRFSTNHIQIRRILQGCGVELRKYSPRNTPNSYQLRIDFE